MNLLAIIKDFSLLVATPTKARWLRKLRILKGTTRNIQMKNNRKIIICTFFAVIIAFKGVCNKLESLLEKNYRWQILHTNDFRQVVLFNINEDFYGRFKLDFWDEFAIYDSVRGDILLMSESNLLFRRFDAFDSNARCYNRKRIFENIGVKYSSFSLDGDDYLAFYILKRLIGLYRVDRIHTFKPYARDSKGVLIFLDRIIDLPYKYPLEQE